MARRRVRSCAVRCAGFLGGGSLDGRSGAMLYHSVRHEEAKKYSIIRSWKRLTRNNRDPKGVYFQQLKGPATNSRVKKRERKKKKKKKKWRIIARHPYQYVSIHAHAHAQNATVGIRHFYRSPNHILTDGRLNPEPGTARPRAQRRCRRLPAASP